VIIYMSSIQKRVSWSDLGVDSPLFIGERLPQVQVFPLLGLYVISSGTEPTPISHMLPHGGNQLASSL